MDQLLKTTARTERRFSPIECNDVATMVPPGRQSGTQKLSVIPAHIFFFVIAGAPLPFGSFDGRSIAFWCIVLGLAAAASSLSVDQLHREHWLLLGGIGLIIIAYAFVLHEQLADHPWIAPFNPLWAKASEMLGTKLMPSVSIARGEPFFALGASLACILALICGLIVGANRGSARQVLQVVAWSGAVYAVYGILSFFIEPTMLLWREKLAYLGSGCLHPFRLDLRNLNCCTIAMILGKFICDYPATGRSIRIPRDKTDQASPADLKQAA